MRPDEFKQQQAGRWMEALALRNAIEDGKAGAHEEQQARLNMKNDPAMRDDEW